MSQLYQFPGPDTRESIHRTIHGYAAGQISRHQMDQRIAIIMSCLRITKININGYTVKLVNLNTWGREPLPVIIIESSGSHQCCPACEASSDSARYIRTAQENENEPEDLVTVWCLECGTIYDTPAKKEDVLKC